MADSFPILPPIPLPCATCTVSNDLAVDEKRRNILKVELKQGFRENWNEPRVDDTRLPLLLTCTEITDGLSGFAGNKGTFVISLFAVPMLALRRLHSRWSLSPPIVASLSSITRLSRSHTPPNSETVSSEARVASYVVSVARSRRFPAARVPLREASITRWLAFVNHLARYSGYNSALVTDFRSLERKWRTATCKNINTSPQDALSENINLFPGKISMPLLPCGAQIEPAVYWRLAPEVQIRRIVTETSTLKSAIFAGVWARAVDLRGDRPMRYSLHHADNTTTPTPTQLKVHLFLVRGGSQTSLFSYAMQSALRRSPTPACMKKAFLDETMFIKSHLCSALILQVRNVLEISERHAQFALYSSGITSPRPFTPQTPRPPSYRNLRCRPYSSPMSLAAQYCALFPHFSQMATSKTADLPATATKNFSECRVEPRVLITRIFLLIPPDRWPLRQFGVRGEAVTPARSFVHHYWPPDDNTVSRSACGEGMTMRTGQHMEPAASTSVSTILKTSQQFQGPRWLSGFDCLPRPTANRVSTLGRATPGFPQMVVVPDNAAIRRILSAISGFLSPSVPALLRSHLISPSSALKTSLLRAAQISQLNSTQTISRKDRDWFFVRRYTGPLTVVLLLYPKDPSVWRVGTCSYTPRPCVCIPWVSASLQSEPQQ
ncbi:hypothetical protein PR048_019282 [Dryococelus australis]|uniref:Uncharacterized protein n=1 Tax=Dryococelus australis TaxID=614101 RepID=A0ABQ9H368_9NEOP|nr:hypothetical protein PR048_019282 [Dryococelus australis]